MLCRGGKAMIWSFCCGSEEVWRTWWQWYGEAWKDDARDACCFGGEEDCATRCVCNDHEWYVCCWLYSMAYNLLLYVLLMVDCSMQDTAAPPIRWRWLTLTYSSLLSFDFSNWTTRCIIYKALNLLSSHFIKSRLVQNPICVLKYWSMHHDS